MCGIVGLHLKDPALEPELGEELGALMVPMIECMGSRGSDSSGPAIFSTPVAGGRFRYSVRLDPRGVGSRGRDACLAR